MSFKKKVNWPSFQKIKEISEKINSEISVSGVSSDNISELVYNLKEWYPAIQIGMESRHLESEYYLENCVLTDIENGKQYLPLLVKSKDGVIIGFISFFADPTAKSLTSPLGVVNPSYRGKGIAYFGPNLLEGIGKELQFNLVYYFVTLETIAQQKVAEALGYKIVGIFPSWDIDLIDNKPQRVSEAVYVKLLNNNHAEQVRTPDLSNLTESTKRLWNFLFNESRENG